MGVARHDHLVAGAGDRHDQRLQTATRAVGRKEGPLGSPRGGRQVFGAPQERTRLLRVVETVGDAHVGREQPCADGVGQVGGSARAELVSRRVEGCHAALAVGEQRCDEWSVALVVLPLSTMRHVGTLLELATVRLSPERDPVTP